jgi:hypothetical protein
MPPSLLPSPPHLALAEIEEKLRPSAAPAAASAISHDAGRSPRLALPSGSFVRSLAPWPHSASALGNPSRLLDPIRWRLPRLVRVVCMGSLVDAFWEFFHGAAVANGSGCLCRMHCLVCKGESSVFVARLGVGGGRRWRRCTLLFTTPLDYTLHLDIFRTWNATVSASGRIFPIAQGNIDPRCCYGLTVDYGCALWNEYETKGVYFLRMYPSLIFQLIMVVHYGMNMLCYWCFTFYTGSCVCVTQFIC